MFVVAFMKSWERLGLLSNILHMPLTPSSYISIDYLEHVIKDAPEVYIFCTQRSWSENIQSFLQEMEDENYYPLVPIILSLISLEK
jgi:hypothetical protein